MKSSSVVLLVGLYLCVLVSPCLSLKATVDLEPCLGLQYGQVCELNTTAAYYVMPWDSFQGTRYCAVTVVIRNTDPASTATFVVFVDRGSQTYSMPADQPSVTLNISLAATDSFQINDISDFGRIAFQAFTNDPACGQKYPLSSFASV